MQTTGISMNQSHIYLSTNGSNIQHKDITTNEWNHKWAGTGADGVSLTNNSILTDISNNSDLFFGSSNGTKFITNVYITRTNPTVIPSKSLACCGTPDLSTIYVGTDLGEIHNVSLNLIDSTLTCGVGKKLVSGWSGWIVGLACSHDGTIIYACFEQRQIYKSTNSGNTFTALTANILAGSTPTWRGLRCSAEGNVVAAIRSDRNVDISVSAGNKWTTRRLPAGQEFRSLDLSSDGSKCIIGTLRGIYILNINILF
jgi:hypothetical protein